MSSQLRDTWVGTYSLDTIGKKPVSVTVEALRKLTYLMTVDVDKDSAFPK